MRVLHLYPDDDQLVASHVAMLREREEPFNGRPDIVHVHGCWRYSIVRQALRLHREGARIVMTPHGGLEPWIVSQRRLTEKLSKTLLWQRRMVENAYVLIAQGPMESTALTTLGWNPRVETIRNAVITNSITPEAMRQHTQEVYRKVMDSDTIELMDAAGRVLLPKLLKAGITGDRRWVTSTMSHPATAASSASDQQSPVATPPIEIPSGPNRETVWRQLLVYADHENVRAVVDRGLHVLGIRPPYVETAHIRSYLPTDYQLPKVENHTVVGIVCEMQHGPLTLRQFVELDRALRRSDADDEAIIEQLTEKHLLRFFRRILQLLQEQTLLDEGFLPISPLDDGATAALRLQLFRHLRI